MNFVNDIGKGACVFYKSIGFPGISFYDLSNPKEFEACAKLSMIQLFGDVIALSGIAIFIMQKYCHNGNRHIAAPENPQRLGGLQQRLKVLRKVNPFWIYIAALALRVIAGVVVYGHLYSLGRFSQKNLKAVPLSPSELYSQTADQEL